MKWIIMGFATLLASSLFLISASAQEPPLPHRPCIAAPTMQLSVGGTGIVQQNLGQPLNVRDEPSTYGRIVGNLSARTVVNITEGPFCGRSNNLFAWWKVEDSASGLVGWVAEGDSFRSQNQYFITPLEQSAIQPEGVACNAAPESILYVGAYGLVNEWIGTDVALRSFPSGQLQRYILFGERFKVIGGPQCGTNQRLFTWWEISLASGERGWIAEGDSTLTNEKYYVRLANEEETVDFREAKDLGCPASPPSILMIGDEVEVRDVGGLPLSLRENPAGAILANLAEGDRAQVVDGPLCGNFYAWWQVQTAAGQVGWVAEGDSTQTPVAYFIALLVSEEETVEIVAASEPFPAPPIERASNLQEASEVLAAPPVESVNSAPLIETVEAPPAAEGDVVISDCQASLPLRLRVGYAAQLPSNLGRVPLRNSPSIVSASSADLVGGAYVVVMNGPRCGDGNSLYTWWQVRSENGVMGWIQESDAAQNPPIYYIEPVQALP